MGRKLSRVIIQSTENTPFVTLDPQGFIKMKGKGMVLNNSENFGQINEWLDGYLQDPAEVTYFSICFEYLNSFCTSKLISIIRKISNVILKERRLVIYWYYEIDDDDILERGEFISEIVKIPFEFVSTADIKTCC